MVSAFIEPQPGRRVELVENRFIEAHPQGGEIMIEQALIAYLGEELSVTAFYGEADPDAATPFVVIGLSGSDDDHPKGAGGITFGEFDFDCYGRDALQALQLAKSIKDEMNNLKGALGAHWVTLMRVINEYDSLEKPTSNYIRTLTFMVNYRG